MKRNIANNQAGFALITAIILLFVATILGLMVTNSSDMEILLSGAQQRYETNLNTSDGAITVEAAVVGTASTVTWHIGGNDYERSYALVNPGINNQTLSPKNKNSAIFDPGSDRTTTAAYNDDNPATWPIDNLLHSASAADNRYDYFYRVVYEHPGLPPGDTDPALFTGYYYNVSAQRKTLIRVGGIKVGPKVSM